MDELFKQLEKLSIDMVHNLGTVTFEDVSHFMEKRELIFSKLSKYEPSPEDKLANKDIVNRILSFEPIIVTKMEELKRSAAKELIKVSSGRIQRNAYDAERQMTDGIFFDQKK
jgi:hypothetical protein